jgi:hypothetical protein
MSTISYLAGGMLGDFIHELSVINEKYLQTGKKGILYISEKGDNFRYGLINTFKDTYNIISQQEYIERYEIYNNQHIDIDLNSWRWNKSVDYKNWYNKYRETYHIEWAHHKWLNVPKEEKWSDKVLVNTTSYRWPIHIDFNILSNFYKNDIIFISNDENQHEFFKKKTGLVIDYYKPSNFDDLCKAINSCKMFVGSLSSPLSIAFAFKKHVIIGECLEEYSSDHGHHYIKGLDTIFKHVHFRSILI